MCVFFFVLFDECMCVCVSGGVGGWSYQDILTCNFLAEWLGGFLVVEKLVSLWCKSTHQLLKSVTIKDRRWW